jgi:hypothetical protein
LGAHWIVVMVAVGVWFEVVGVLLGGLEIKASRRTAMTLSRSVQKVYVDEHDRLVAISGSATLAVTAAQEPTFQEKIEQHLAAHPAEMKELRNELTASEQRVTERWQSDLKAVAEASQQTTDDVRAALERFADELAGGWWRRYPALGLLLVGAVMQAAASIVSTLMK